jgi:DNA-binding NarL/FixJ family response regulator
MAGSRTLAERGERQRAPRPAVDGTTRVGLRIVVAETNEVVRRGLLGMLGAIDMVDFATGTSSANDGLRLLRDHGRMHVLIVGSVGDATVAETARVVIERSDCRLLVLIPNADSSHLRKAVGIQAHGYLVLSELTTSKLAAALDHVQRTGMFIPPEVGSHLLAQARRDTPELVRLEGYLSPRERDVLELLIAGLSNGDISRSLGISIHSAKRHVSSILTKLDSPSRTHLVSKVLQSRLS